MVVFPVRVDGRPYKGTDPRRQVQYQASLNLASKVEEYINSRMEAEYMCEFDYWIIAHDLGVEKEEVRDLLYPIDGGSNGITVVNPKNERVDKPRE